MSDDSDFNDLNKLDQIVYRPVKEEILELGPRTKPKDFPNEPLWQWVKTRRRSKKPELRAMAEILNRVLTNRQHKFLMSRRSLARILGRSRDMNSKSFEAILDKILSRVTSNDCFLKMLQHHSNNSRVHGRSSSGVQTDLNQSSNGVQSESNRSSVGVQSEFKRSSNGSGKYRASIYTLGNTHLISLIPWWNSEKASHSASQTVYQSASHDLVSVKSSLDYDLVMSSISKPNQVDNGDERSAFSPGSWLTFEGSSHDDPELDKTKNYRVKAVNGQLIELVDHPDRWFHESLFIDEDTF
jgi:hypothetical protein